jgi:hypothetical protein
MPTPDLNRDIFKDNAYEPEFEIVKKKSSNGALIPAAGIVGATIHVSATDGGPAIDPALSGAAAERSAAPGKYSTPFAISVINALLFPTFDGKAVYNVWIDPADPTGSKVSEKVYCWSVRPAG